MIIAANFKTNHTRGSTASYLGALSALIEDSEINQDVIVFPPATALHNEPLPSNITLGAQNAYPVENGSYTGEIGLEQLSEFDIDTILIGHSERRHILGESLESVKAKFDFYKEKGFRIVFCVGEKIETREQGIDATMEYIWKQFEGIDTSYDNLVIAYEPVWAIGTGLTATTKEIEETHTLIKEKLDKPLLYGGSVKLENCSEILRTNNVDGILVGTASWQVQSFEAMIEVAQTIENGVKV